MSMMADLISLNAVIDRWRGEGVELLPPVDAARAAASLDRTGRKYSCDVVGFYCAAGGMKDGGWDDYCVSFWSLDKVVAENSGYARPHILFADVLIHSYCFCFRYENAERSSVCVELFDDSEPELIAGSVDEFFDLYLRNARKLGL
jgi:hypothetical protein